jgi:hypothetical protein
MRHYSGIDYEHFLDDIRDMYPFSVEEAVLVELIANSLDAKASLIDIRLDPERNIFELTDTGKGMDKKGFEMYHNFSTSFKRKGQGIGFAGLGAKLALKIAHEIITETRCRNFWGASEWKFERRAKVTLPVWYDVPVRSLATQGTRVQIHLKQRSKVLSAVDEVRKIIIGHYLPLLAQHEFYGTLRLYKRVTILVNGEVLAPPGSQATIERTKHYLLHRGATRRPFALAHFELHRQPVPEEVQGIAIATFGKVVRREFFKQFFPGMERVTGLIEVPELVECLTTNKCDFRRDGTPGNKYYRFNKVGQREFRRWLEELTLLEQPERKTDKEVLRLQRLVNQIVGEIPDLQQFYGSRGERESLVKDASGSEYGSVPLPQPRGEDVRSDVEAVEERLVTLADAKEGARTLEEGDEHAATRRLRTGRFGPSIQYASLPERKEISWMEGDTVLINTAHPTFVKAQEKKVAEYHNLVAVAVAMLREVPTGEEKLGVLERFMSQWGRM